MAAPNFNTNQVSVGATATLIVAQNTGRHAVLIVNLGTTAIYVGPNDGVTAANGMILPGVVGAALSIPSASAIWGISSGSSQSVAFLDV